MATILKKTFFVLLLGSNVLLTAPATFADWRTIITPIITTLTLLVPMITGTGMVSDGLTRSIEIPSARMDHIRSIRVRSALIVTMINLKLARNSGSNPSAGFVDNLLNLGKEDVVSK